MPDVRRARPDAAQSPVEFYAHTTPMRSSLSANLFWGMKVVVATASIFTFLLLMAIVVDHRVAEMGLPNLLASYAMTAVIAGAVVGVLRPYLTSVAGSAAGGLAIGYAWYVSMRVFVLRWPFGAPDLLLSRIVGVPFLGGGLAIRRRMLARGRGE